MRVWGLSMKILVLGGSVFIGKHMVQTLVESGHDVSVLNRGQTPVDLPPGVERIVADRTDAESMRSALKGQSWDAAFDISGFVMIAGGADVSVLLDLLDGHVGHYVYTSSIMAYAQGRGVFPWTEDGPMNDEGPEGYGGFKVAMERHLLARHRDTGFPVSIIRPAAVYGPDNNIFDMETPMFLRLRQQRPILVPHGGLVVVSYGHVDDLCRGMLACIGKPEALGEVINITAEAVTVNEYVRVLAAIVGVQPNIVYLPDEALPAPGRPAFGHLFSSMHHGVLSIAKAQRILGFEPMYDFQAGHEHTYAWFGAQGWGTDTKPLNDPLWDATWDFDFEAKLAEGVPARQAARAVS
jgi:nucleoside-diphosphate-sugar epimerase